MLAWLVLWLVGCLTRRFKCLLIDFIVSPVRAGVGEAIVAASTVYNSTALTHFIYLLRSSLPLTSSVLYWPLDLQVAKKIFRICAAVSVCTRFNKQITKLVKYSIKTTANCRAFAAHSQSSLYV